MKTVVKKRTSVRKQPNRIENTAILTNFPIFKENGAGRPILHSPVKEGKILFDKNKVKDKKKDKIPKPAGTYDLSNTDKKKKEAKDKVKTPVKPLTPPKPKPKTPTKAKPKSPTPKKVKSPTPIKPKSPTPKKENVKYEKMTVVQIKALLREEKKPLAGNKAELIARLRGVNIEKPKNDKPVTPKNVGVEKSLYEKMKVPQLKDELKKRKLAIGGKKADLVAKLVQNDLHNAKPKNDTNDGQKDNVKPKRKYNKGKKEKDNSTDKDQNSRAKDEDIEPPQDYSKMKVADLRALLKKKGKPYYGTKAVLVQRLQK